MVAEIDDVQGSLRLTVERRRAALGSVVGQALEAQDELGHVGPPRAVEVSL